MPNLDRFSQVMPWEWIEPIESSNEAQVQEPIRCACGCETELWLEDEETYIVSEFWEDEYIQNDPKCIKKYNAKQKNDQLVASQSF
ncbi:MAG: hypothetical protein ACI35R_15660 [Bacillus sp. (in: firmicutes)]